MRIAHVVDSMEVGGAEVLVSQMCRVQREHGHEVSVYALASLGPLGEQLQREGFRVEANLVGHLRDALPRFYRMFRKSRPDVVHMHNPTPTIYAACGARLAGVPSIISTRHSLVGPPRRLAMELKYGVAALFCDRIVGICDATTENLKRLHTVPERKIVRVYNGTIPVKRVPVERCPPGGGCTLLFVGRLAPVKNLTLLLRAFTHAIASRPDLRLWIVGDGSERVRLECLANELDITYQVTFWGQQLDVNRFFSAADIFVMSSVSEGLPVSLLQALSAGLPAIVTDVGGMAEVVRFSRAGIPVSPDDAKWMATAILELSEDHDRRISLGTNAKSAFMSTFCLSHMITEYEKLYASNEPSARRVRGSPGHPA